jgi:peptide/nickel transport system ATP-binding protein
MSAHPLLEVENLQTEFRAGGQTVRAVDGLSFTLAAGEVLGLVGESGCGKSMTALSILRLVDGSPGICGGSVRLDGRDLLGLPEAQMRQVRGGDIGMIFQEPMTSLNPVLTIGRQLTEAVRLGGASRMEARERAAELLHLVRIPDAAGRLADYPHHFSGGMRQRVMIAMALARSPRLLIADEPTTALDVTVQAQILDLLIDLRDRLGMAIILITHDLGVVAETCDRAVVMYAGRKIEEAPVSDLFARPQHPYTLGLMKSVPHMSHGGVRPARLSEIPGMVPSPAAMPEGCRFAPRCALAIERCATYPDWRQAGTGHVAACWRAGEVADAF